VIGIENVDHRTCRLRRIYTATSVVSVNGTLKACLDVVSSNKVAFSFKIR
jgi:hypothetical protein